MSVFFTIMKLPHRNPYFFFNFCSLHLRNSFYSIPVLKNGLGTSSCIFSEKIYKSPKILKAESEPSTVESKKKKAMVQRITLIGTDDSICVSTKEEAEKLSKRRDLKLVKIVDLDTKSQRPVYRLMTSAQYLEEEKKQKSENKKQKKVEKMLTVNCTIAENDLQSKLNQLIKWLSKGNHAKIIINGDESQAGLTDKVYNFMKTNIEKHGKLSPKVVKASGIRFNVVPLPKQDEKTNDIGQNK